MLTRFIVTPPDLSDSFHSFHELDAPYPILPPLTRDLRVAYPFIGSHAAPL